MSLPCTHSGRLLVRRRSQEDIPHTPPCHCSCRCLQSTVDTPLPAVPTSRHALPHTCSSRCPVHLQDRQYRTDLQLCSLSLPRRSHTRLQSNSSLIRRSRSSFRGPLLTSPGRFHSLLLPQTCTCSEGRVYRNRYRQSPMSR